MDVKESKRKTKLHKPVGGSRKVALNSHHAQEYATRIVGFKRRDSLPELCEGSLSALSFPRQKDSTFENESKESSVCHNLFAEVPSYNLWKSWASDRKGSLPRSLNLQQRKPSTSSNAFVPSVINHEIKRFRKYSMPLLRGSMFERRDENTGKKHIGNTRSGDSGQDNVAIYTLPNDNSWKQVNNLQHSAKSRSPSFCDSDITIRRSISDISLAQCSNEKESPEAKESRIKRWLSEVE